MDSNDKEISEQEVLLALATSVNNASFDLAFTLLESKYREKLMKKLFSLLRERTMAEDILQEALLSAALSLKGFPTERILALKLQAWLFRITINEAKQHLKKKKLPQMSIHSEAFDGEFLDRLEVPMQERPDSALEAVEINERVQNAILQLPKQYQQPLSLYFVEEYSYLEIVEQLGLSEGTLKAQIFRGRKLLRAALKTLVEEEG